MVHLPRLVVALSEKHNVDRVYAYCFLRNGTIGHYQSCRVVNSALYAAALCLIGMCCPVAMLFDWNPRAVLIAGCRQLLIARQVTSMCKQKWGSC